MTCEFTTQLTPADALDLAVEEAKAVILEMFIQGAVAVEHTMQHLPVAVRVHNELESQSWHCSLVGNTLTVEYPA